jgi:purine-binding chemotaxis protein CheW
MSTVTEPSQYLTFRIDEELFALNITKVREVLEFSAITRVPRMPDFMRGVINLRGNVVPVVDLKLKLGLSRTEKTIDTRVVITEVEVDGEKTVLGALADSVQEVLELDPSQIAPAPRMGTRIDTSCILGMGKRDDQFIILLDIDHVLTASEIRSTRRDGPGALEGGAAPPLPTAEAHLSPAP